MTPFATLLYSVQGAVATITLNRPEARNALDGTMCEELRRAAAMAGDDVNIRVAFVRGNGPAFCAGADVKERASMSAEQVRERRLKAFAAYEALEAVPKPVVAVVHGAALGSGVEIAACCDFVVATPDAVFGTPEALRGTVGATQRLPRVLGKRLAKDLMFTGRRLTAAEAQAAGFVARVVAPGKLEHELANISQSVMVAPASAIRLAKQCIDRGIELDPRGALAVELAAIDEQLASGKGLDKA
jgi:enoyl-CoA hydratase